MTNRYYFQHHGVRCGKYNSLPHAMRELAAAVGPGFTLKDRATGQVIGKGETFTT